MKKLILLLIVICLPLAIFAQKAKPTPKKAKTPIVKETVNLNDKEEFERIKSIEDLSERISALRKFTNDFPNSDLKNRAFELISSSYAQIADEKLRLNEIEDGIKFFQNAANAIPTPMSDEFFLKVALQFPNNLFWRGQQNLALEIAKIIEQKAEGNAKQLSTLATFYLGIENAVEAQRIAEKALKIEPNLSAIYRTLAMAHRQNFKLEESANAYAKSLELEPTSIASKISLAEMKRALGKFDEAITLYNEVLEKDAENLSAETGLILSLFDSEKIPEAEQKLAKSLEKNPNNLFLTVGVAYWYATRKNGEKAIEYGQKAVTIEPRYTWGHIALARGYLLQNKSLEAEKALLFAKNYGNFPTLDYEIATARLQAGFYEESATILQTRFKFDEKESVTDIGGKTYSVSKGFIDLLAMERRASIFQTVSADSPENSERLKNLLSFWQNLNAEKIDETQLLESVDSFVKGEDANKSYRKIFVASRLLQKQIAYPKILELMQNAIDGLDESADLPNASSAVLADELIEPRTIAISRQTLVAVPTIPRQTLLNILRGRIEEISGWALFQQDKKTESAIRLKRAVGILPEKSAWWRSAIWRYAMVLEENGKSQEALDNFIKFYKNSQPNEYRQRIIQAVFKKVYGSLDDFEKRVGVKPIESLAEVVPNPTTPKPLPTPVEKKEEAKETATIKPSETPSATPKQITPKPLFEPIIIKVGETNQDKTNCLNPDKDSISIIANGGSLGILVGFTNETTREKITVTSSSVEDIEISLEPEIVKSSNRAFYIIKSISEKTGEFKVTFESPCGKKEVLVKVR
ncbi:MAG: hypothetical protein MUC29_07905 [Pyrinomonadaceae bacterium]|nr:hypothetical protein [Pyrinomonadaceae bacterium]